MRRRRHRVQAAALEAFLRLCRVLPLDFAASLMGGVGRLVGPWLPSHRVAAENLEYAFPDKAPEERRAILKAMWTNLGRGAAEFAHLDRIYPADRVEVVGGEHLDRLREDEVGAVVFSCHCGNWELLSPVLVEHGISPTMLYRPSSNEAADRAIQARRLAAHDEGAQYFPSTNRGFRQLVAALRKGAHIAMLVDLKAKSEGTPVSLFGRETIVPTGGAQLALAFDVPIVPARIERLEGKTRFRLTLFPPLEPVRTGDTKNDAERLTREMMAMAEGWIRERPEQWLWLYRRWPKLTSNRAKRRGGDPRRGR